MKRKRNAKRFIYILPSLKPDEFPHIKKNKFARVRFRIDNSLGGSEIAIDGTSEGLLYFARFLVALALHDKATEGMHVHLPLYGKIEKDSLPLSIYKVSVKHGVSKKRITSMKKHY
ncbi:MAG: hypothetical protein HY811_12170 [Planctomycetes bacterium]|nr:hypothetical protein [Planctomycetota bacterium]